MRVCVRVCKCLHTCVSMHACVGGCIRAFVRMRVCNCGCVTHPLIVRQTHTRMHTCVTHPLFVCNCGCVTYPPTHTHTHGNTHTRTHVFRWEGAMKALCFDEDATFSQTHSSSEGKRAKAVETWGTPTSVADVQEVFRRFYQSEVSQLPWYVCV